MTVHVKWTREGWGGGEGRGKAGEEGREGEGWGGGEGRGIEGDYTCEMDQGRLGRRGRKGNRR